MIGLGQWFQCPIREALPSPPPGSGWHEGSDIIVRITLLSGTMYFSPYLWQHLSFWEGSSSPWMFLQGFPSPRIPKNSYCDPLLFMEGVCGLSKLPEADTTTGKWKNSFDPSSITFLMFTLWEKSEHSIENWVRWLDYNIIVLDYSIILALH